MKSVADATLEWARHMIDDECFPLFVLHADGDIFRMLNIGSVENHKDS